jgi:apolipoprotein D and lipocalin family protein
MKLIFKIIIALCLTAIISTGFAKVKIASKAVKDVDLKKYSGVWYEIARLNHPEEKNLVGVTVTYKLLPNGEIEVLSQGNAYTLKGEKKEVKGVAVVPNPKETGIMKMRYADQKKINYYILHVDQNNYDYALVGDDKLEHLWILSRTPQMDLETFQTLSDEAKGLGYNTEKLNMVQQAE